MMGARFKKSLLGSLFLGLPLMLTLTSPALAVETKWNVLEGDWNVSENWTNGIPDNKYEVFIDIPGANVYYPSADVSKHNSGNPTLNSLLLDPSDPLTGDVSLEQVQDILTVQNTKIGCNGTGSYFHDAGTNKVLQDLNLGYAANGEGYYFLNGGSLLVGGHETLGRAGRGFMFQYPFSSSVALGRSPSLGCTPHVPPPHVTPPHVTPPPATPPHSVGKNLYLGVKPNGFGEFDISDSSLTVGGSARVGIKGTGTFNQNNSIVKIKGDYYPDPQFDEGAPSHSPEFSVLSKKNLKNNKLECVSSREPGLIVGLENTGKYLLTGGTLNVNYSEIIGLDKGGKGSFIQTNGAHTINGDLYLGRGTDSDGNFDLSVNPPPSPDTPTPPEVGLLDVHGFGSVGYLGEGNFLQTGGTVKIWGIDQEVNLKGKSLSNPLSKGSSLSCSQQQQYIGLTIGRGGKGRYSLDDGELWVSHGEIIGMLLGSNGLFEQNGGKHFIGGNLTIARDLGSTGSYLLGNPPDDEGKPVPTPDGVKLKVQGSLLNNEGGTFDYYGGEFVANVINKGTFKAYGSGTRSFPNQFFNYGTFTIKGNSLGTAEFAQKFRNYGLYQSISANNEFTYLYVAPQGSIVAGGGDNYYVKKEFTNTSTQNTANTPPVKKWATDAANLIFTGPGRKPFKAGSADNAGFKDNFAWNSFEIEGNGSVQLLDVLYAHKIRGLTANTENKITNLFGTCGTRIYYDTINLDFSNVDKYILTKNGYKQVGYFTSTGYVWDCQ